MPAATGRGHPAHGTIQRRAGRSAVAVSRRSLLPLALALVVTLGACTPKPMLPYTLDTPPLVLVPASEAGVVDQRGRFREILCAVTEDHGATSSHPRPCAKILHRLLDEPPGTGAPVHLGPPRLKLRIALVPGLGAECVAAQVGVLPFALEHLEDLGYRTTTIRVDGLSSSARNAEQIRDAVLAMDLAPDERLVLVGYSKGTIDIVEGLVSHPEMAGRVAAVISLAGAVNGSPLADDASDAWLSLLQHLPGSECDEGDGGALDSLARSTRLRRGTTRRLPETVRYFSVAIFTQRERISLVLRGSYDQLALVDPRNDSQLLFYDQIIAPGALLGFVDADHWAVALPITRQLPALAATLVDHNAFPREILLEAIVRHVEEQLLIETSDPPRPAGAVG